MGLMTYLPLAIIAAAVLVPLAREYADFRRTWGLTRSASLVTTLLVLPSLGVGLAVGVAVADSFAAQWTATVIATIVLYSAATAAVRSALEPAPAPRRHG